MSTGGIASQSYLLAPPSFLLALFSLSLSPLLLRTFYFYMACLLYATIIDIFAHTHMRTVPSFPFIDE